MPMIEIASTTAVMMRTGMNSISARKPTNHDFTGSAATRSAICSTGVLRDEQHERRQQDEQRDAHERAGEPRDGIDAVHPVPGLRAAPTLRATGCRRIPTSLNRALE